MLQRFLISFFLFCGLVYAQSLADLLPTETFIALGARDLGSQQAKLQPFIDEFERLNLSTALSQILTSGSEADQTTLTLPSELEGLGPLDFAATEAWIALSISRFNPLPVVTLLSHLSATASSRFDALISQAASEEGVETAVEGSISFYQKRFTSENTPPLALAFAKQGQLLMLSSSPDVLRGVLRQIQGSKDPSFGKSEAYGKTLANLGEANFMAYLDYAQVPKALASYVKGLGFDKLVTRLTNALETAGVSAGVLRFSASGLESESLQAVNRQGKDKLLLKLLSTSSQVDNSLLNFYSTEAYAFSAQTLNLAGWWDFLNDISASTPELGGSLDELLSMFLTVNLRDSLFSWTGEQFASLSTGASQATIPGVASSNLLGEQVFILEAKDEAKAKEGLSQLFAKASQGIAAFTDPSGGAGNAKMKTQEQQGITLYSYEISSGITLSFAIVKGYALIATSTDALSIALTNYSEPEAADFFTTLPESATGFGISDDRRNMETSSQQLISQLQLLAGFGGASNLNFEAVDDASNKLSSFMKFIAERLGKTISYSEQRPEGMYSSSRSEIRW